MHEELIFILKNAKSWFELHEKLARVGFVYRKKGGGAILICSVDGKHLEIKPSSLFKEGSLKFMEKRLGKFEPTSTLNSNQITREVTSLESEESKAFRELEDEKKILTFEKKKLVDFAKQNLPKNSMQFEALCGAIKEHTKGQIENLVDRYREKIANFKNFSYKTTSFEAWLQLNKPAEEYIGYKEAIENLENSIYINQCDFFNDSTVEEKIELFKEYHRAVKAEKYRITFRDESDGRFLVLGKESRYDKSLGWTPEKIIENMSVISEYEKKKKHVYYTPLSTNKNHFIIDDLTECTLKKLIRDNFRPTCILESSPKNYQAIYTLPRINSEFEHRIILDLAQGLNSMYGDINVNSAEHAHRAPGFKNFKEKHKLPDGTYPLTKIVSSEGKICETFQYYIEYAEKYYNSPQYKQILENNQLNDSKIDNDFIKKTEDFVRNDIKLYYVHYNDILRLNYSRFNGNINHDWIDSMIALRLRITGHSVDEISWIIKDGAKDIRSKLGIKLNEYNRQNPSNGYAKMCAKSAFTTDGDKKAEKYKKYKKIWSNLERDRLNDNFYFVIENQKLKLQTLDLSNIKVEKESSLIEVTNKNDEILNPTILIQQKILKKKEN